MKILLASSEVHPYSKTGGLADMVGALARALARAGHEVGVVTPLYTGLRERFPELAPVEIALDLTLGKQPFSGRIWSLAAAPNLTVYFVDRPEFFYRGSLYQESGTDYPDNAARFVFFSKAVTHLARSGYWRPDLVHCHDWQSGLVPLFILHQKLREGWKDAPRTCFTIHNLAYQGQFPYADFELTNLPGNYFHQHSLEFYGGMNCLKAGILFADVITTVSPRYAREITTPEFGCGLEGVLRQRQVVLAGMLNGVDYEEWNTTRNPHLKHAYDVNDWSGKAQQKAELQRELGLAERPDVPLFGTITRIVDQKGMDLLLGALEEMLATELQFVLLGTGSRTFERAFLELAQRRPGKAAVRIGYDAALAHRIEAGCDFYLMPSRFEPCGLNQMYSLRYGTVPIVRAVGGLDDSVIDLTESQDEANGIKFHEYSVRALVKAIQKALALYHAPEVLDHYRHNGMRVDFSWEKTARTYVELYERALNLQVNPPNPAFG